MMNCTVNLLDRTIRVEISAAAEQQLGKLDGPLRLEMELYFSCLIRKRVLVRQNLSSDFRASVSDQLEIGFRPVMTKTCSITDTHEDGRPPLTDFPIAKPERYIPHWLKLDYRHGEWRGEFGYID